MIAVFDGSSMTYSQNKSKNMELLWNKHSPVKNSTVIATIDTHAAGEPLRIITGGLPEIQGTTMLERRRYMLEHLDYIRRALMWEPRGHYNMYGCIATQWSFLSTSGTVTSIL